MTAPLILFDLDGTLVDSAPDIARALNATMAEVGVPALPVARVVRCVGDGATRLVERALPPGASDAPAYPEVPDLVTRFRRHYAAAICVESRPYPGIVDVLTELAGAGTPMAVLTNKPGDLARSLLRALALDRFFDDVIGDGDGWARKPAPDGARAILARHGVPAAAALVVGDGVPDLRLGRAAGCPVAAVTWGYTARHDLEAEAPDYLIDEAAALLVVARGPSSVKRAP
jgi:phosphoglycolate phosphatase